MSLKVKKNAIAKSLERKISELNKAREKIVAVGVLRDFNSKYDDGENVVDVAILNEFGGKSKINGKEVDIPSRPFMRQTASNNKVKLRSLQKNLINKMLTGDISLDDALGKMGIFYASAIKSTILHGDFVPNHPLTIAKKGSDKPPLIDTRRLLNSINYAVRSRSSD